MFNGLSLDQAPPISVVLRFFLTVPIFGILLSLLMIIDPEAVMTPAHPFSLGAIHLMFLGIVTMSMIGALFQMQSVLGGKPIPSALGNALIVHTLLTAGVLSLAGAFVGGLEAFFVIASVLLGSAIIHTVFLILPLLFGGITHDTLRGMRLALVSLGVTALLGIVMAQGYAEGSFSSFHLQIREAHYSIGLIGWVAVLIIAVAFQVVEMFYVTSPYNAWCKRNAFRIIGGALVLKVLWLFASLPYPIVFDAVMAALLAGFVATTLKRLQERKRRVIDVSIWFWKTGIALLSLALVLYLTAAVSGIGSFNAAALIAFALFALSIILGMMSKIVPFLVWFHLNASGYMETPIMSNIIPASRSKALFALFAFSSATAVIAPAFPVLARFSGIGWFALFSLLGYNLFTAARLYRRIRTTGERFEFSPPDTQGA